jgi:hypothetical protein
VDLAKSRDVGSALKASCQAMPRYSAGFRGGVLRPTPAPLSAMRISADHCAGGLAPAQFAAISLVLIASLASPGGASSGPCRLDLPGLAQTPHIGFPILSQSTRHPVSIPARLPRHIRHPSLSYHSRRLPAPLLSSRPLLLHPRSSPRALRRRRSLSRGTSLRHCDSRPFEYRLSISKFFSL